jgi:hypothetical protein
MWELSDNYFFKIVHTLERLETRLDHSKRENSWMTAYELLPVIEKEQTPEGAKALDAALRARFLSDDDCDIRPAYYPGEDNCERLWGHVSNVGSLSDREALCEKLAMRPLTLEPDGLEENAPLVFLSHALVDHHFAARVRLALARFGIRSWIAEGELHEGDNLFEGVKAALGRCDTMMVLITSYSISSAWLDSEATSAMKEGKEIVALVDATDAPVCELLRELLPRASTKPSGSELDNWLSGDGIKLTSAVLKRFMRVSSPSRILKFKIALKKVLESMTFYGVVAFYPVLPQSYPEVTGALSFEDMLDELKLRSG